jgi:hypothetical protein
LNSNNGIEFIFLSNLFVLLQISEGLNYLNLIQTNGLKKVKVHCALGPLLLMAQPSPSSGLAILA